MKLLTKVAIAMLFGIGLPITLYAATELLNPNTSRADRSDALSCPHHHGLAANRIGQLVDLECAATAATAGK